jgi:LysM repeat protein
MIRILISLLGFFNVLTSVAQQTDFFAKVINGDLFIEHVVMPKENWYSIGRIYHLSPKDIAPFNQLSLDKGLSIGQLVKIPLLETNFAQQSNGSNGIPVFHKVQPKEGLFRIAENFHVSMAALKEFNHLNSDQVKIGEKLVIGFLKQSGKTEDVVASSPPRKSGIIDNKTIASQDEEKPVVNSSAKEKSNAALKESPKSETVKKDVTEKSTKTDTQPSSIPTSAETLGTGFFSSLYNQQSLEGKEQHLEAFIYGTFKSTSGWDDQKYYVLLNDVTPGTAVKISAKGTDKVVYAKVLGAVPPGKESEGLSMRMSSATAVALGITDTNAQLMLDWYK